MAIGLLSADGVSAASFSVDLAANTQLNHAGPYLVQLIAWVHTADAGAVAGQFAMTHRDPSGTDRASAGINGTLNLNDATSFFSTAVEGIQRQSSSSLWTLDFGAFMPGTALISYRLQISPLESTDYSAL